MDRRPRGRRRGRGPYAGGSGAAVLTHFAGLRRLIAEGLHDAVEVEHHLVEFERDLRHALEHCHHHGGYTPAVITLTVQ